METKTEEAEQQSAASAPAAMRPTCPRWLQAAIADIEQRVRSLAVDEECATEHSFAARAENYYQKRPQLLSLLTDLHHRYLYLAERYSQSMAAKNLHAIAAAAAAVSSSDDGCSSESEVDDHSSDAGSSLSFQFQQPMLTRVIDCSTTGTGTAAVEMVVAEVVMAWVDRDVLADEAERRRAEAARKMELQGSLVEVLESERLVLLGENARLEEELGYMRRRAAEMARLVVKLREDHRVCIMGRRIEALQAQVYGLELRNRECYETMAKWEADRIVGAAEMNRLRADNRRLLAATTKKKHKGKGWWWSRVRMAAEWRTPSQVTVKGNNYYGGCFCV